MTDTSFRGLFPILAMPFDENGNVDEEDLRKEVEFCISTGADGLGLAMASEIPKLSEDERNLATKTVVEQSEGRAKVVINTSATSTELTIHMSQNAAELGADSIMIIPPTGVSEYEIRSHYENISQSINLPIFIQDIDFAPVAPELAAKLARDNENVSYAKVETLPTPPRVSEAVNKGEGNLIVFGGAGGSFLVEELLRGAVGTMPWVSIPEAYRKTLDLFFAGKPEEARSNINRFEPILRTLAQPQVCFSFTKEILKMRGVFKSNNVRKPYDIPDLDAFTELQRLVNELELTAYAF